MGAWILLVFGIVFVAGVLVFFGWFFATMIREDEEGEEKQERLRKSPVLKGFAKGYSARHGALFFPKSFGRREK